MKIHEPNLAYHNITHFSKKIFLRFLQSVAWKTGIFFLWNASWIFLISFSLQFKKMIFVQLCEYTHVQDTFTKLIFSWDMAYKTLKYILLFATKLFAIKWNAGFAGFFLKIALTYYYYHQTSNTWSVFSTSITCYLHI